MKWAIWLGVWCLCASGAVADIGYSGMARVADDAFLVVNDRKASVPGYRLGIITVNAERGVVFRALEVADWKDPDGPANDLEACCAIPGRPQEYLVAESGYVRRKFGRVFHLRLTRGMPDAWGVEVLQAFRLAGPPGDEGTTADGDQIEGIACFRFGAKTVLVCASRGSNRGGAPRLSRLTFGELDLQQHRFTRWAEVPLVASSLLNDRDCADLLVRAENGVWALWAVATVDVGDLGPYRSMVYRAGTFVPNVASGQVDFRPDQAPGARYEIHGLKVEAIAEPAATVPGSAFSIATDDEAYGGIWRPLF
ncbi:MAG: hypothetical protein RMJ43_10815 [Chloroherpetonaceae bacterium]|nr:hypothetical protein [Chthonomonadaceae bacterium]MDW8208319.1 hypothetical protein [Chloroherpetonaceae bacterium]